MRISSIRLSNFKRFTGLEIRNIPSTSKLVLVVGPNGCGKSSLFDALLQWYRIQLGIGYSGDNLYYWKDLSLGLNIHQNVHINLHGNATVKQGSLYVRTAYRNDPDFSITGLNRLGSPSEGVRIGRVIDNDQTVSENYQRLIYDTMSGVYDTANDGKSVGQLREELIGQIRKSMKAVFGDLLLNNISDPLGNGSFFFEKGTVKNYHYKNLSGGEKAAFDLLLDFHVKKRFFSDAIYCIDEIETHLHTRIQGTLLKEIVTLLPGESQLWVTTHSLGVIQAALEISTQQPGSVSVIDFDGIDLDTPSDIEPSNLGRITWEKLLSVALDDLSKRVSPRHVVVCEGSSTGSRRKDFDAEIYNRIFRQSESNIVFVSGGNSQQVKDTGVSVANTLGSILLGTEVYSLMDRDDRSPSEVASLRSEGNLVLEQRNIESYLLADEVIEALAISVNQEALSLQAKQVKIDAIAASVGRGNPPDDLKSAAGSIYTALKKLLGLTRCGNNTEEFMRDTLAPLISPNMQCYIDLKSCIIDNLK